MSSKVDSFLGEFFSSKRRALALSIAEGAGELSLWRFGRALSGLFFGSLGAGVKRLCANRSAEGGGGAEGGGSGRRKGGVKLEGGWKGVRE